MFGGGGRAEAEVVLPRRAYDRYKPKYAVLIDPVGVEVNDGMCDCAKLIDSTIFSDILGSAWQVCVWGKTTLEMFDGPQSAQYAKTLEGRYSERGLSIAWGGRGMIHHPSMQFSRGLEVVIDDQKWQKRLGFNSGIGMMSRQSARKPEINWPLVICQDGEVGGNLDD